MTATQVSTNSIPMQSTTTANNSGSKAAFGHMFSYFLKKNDALKSKLSSLQAFNSLSMLAIKKEVEKQEIQETLQSVKGGGVYFENMPVVSFDEQEKGWRQIYLGVLSPYTNKYQKYVDLALRKAQQEKLMNKLPRATSL